MSSSAVKMQLNPLFSAVFKALQQCMRESVSQIKSQAMQGSQSEKSMVIYLWREAVTNAAGQCVSSGQSD